MSTFDFSEVECFDGLNNSTADEGSFDFFQQHSITGLINSSFPQIRRSGSGISTDDDVTVTIGDDSYCGLRGGVADRSKRRVESGPQSQIDLQSMRTRREAQIIRERKSKRSSRFAMQRRMESSDESKNGKNSRYQKFKTAAEAGEEVNDIGMDTSDSAPVTKSFTEKDAFNTYVTDYRQQIHQTSLQQHLSKNCALLTSENLADQYDGVIWFRKKVSGEMGGRASVFVNEVLTCGIMPRIVSFLAVGYNVEIQKEACLAISHLACADGDDIGHYMVECGVIPLLVKLLTVISNDVAKERLRETCLSCIGNLSAYTKECRDLLLGNGVLEPLLAQLGIKFRLPGGTSLNNVEVFVADPSVSPSLAAMTYLSWSFDNLSKGEPPPPDHVTHLMIMPISFLLQSLDELVVLTSMNTLLTMCESSRNEVNVQMLLDHGMLGRVYEILVSLPTESVCSNRNGDDLGVGNDSSASARSGGYAKPHQRHFDKTKLTSFTTVTMRNLGLRVFAAALRCSKSNLNKRTAVCHAHFPRLIPMMVTEIARTAEIKPTLGMWGSMRAKGNDFYQGRASDLYKVVPIDPDDGALKASAEYEARRFEVEYDIKLELVAAINALLSLDVPKDRKYTLRLLNLNLLPALYSAISYGHFNLNVVVVHCVCLLLERLDYSGVALRPMQHHWSAYQSLPSTFASAPLIQQQVTPGFASLADQVVPTVREAVLLLLELLPSLQTDLDVLMLILHRTVHLLDWARSLGLQLLDCKEAVIVVEKMQHLSVHAHQDVSAWANMLLSLLEAIISVHES